MIVDEEEMRHLIHKGFQYKNNSYLTESIATKMKIIVDLIREYLSDNKWYRTWGDIKGKRRDLQQVTVSIDAEAGELFFPQ